MKKYLSIFLIFFLLFSVSFPAFGASTSDIVPPDLAGTGYDSYLISERALTGGRSDYICILYNSSDWDIFCNEDSVYPRLISFIDTPTQLTNSIVLSSAYDSSTDNNGWGTFTPFSYIDFEFNDGSIYHYFSMQGEFVICNRDIPFASLNKDTKTLDYTGEFFFTLTPPLVVEVEKALTLFQIQTIQTIMIILLCGVGCLALLISLPILKKILSRFLNK